MLAPGPLPARPPAALEAYLQGRGQPLALTPPISSQAVMEADEDEARSCRTPGRAVLVGNACRKGDANGVARLMSFDDQSR